MVRRYSWKVCGVGMVPVRLGCGALVIEGGAVAASGISK
jgi:hypothetical protein